VLCRLEERFVRKIFGAPLSSPLRFLRFVGRGSVPGKIFFCACTSELFPLVLRFLVRGSVSDFFAFLFYYYYFLVRNLLSCRLLFSS
jgi:hypothetical protein